MTTRSKMERLLEERRFLVSAELTPPRHHDPTRLLQHARAMAGCVDVVQINDHLLSQARCANMAVGHLVRQEGVEPVLQFSLRHRNKIALQGDLLGMAALGLSNLIILGGYPCSIGSDPDAKEVSDVDSLTAIRLTSRMTREGKLFNGDGLSPAPYFHVGTIDFPCPEQAIAGAMERLAAKIEAGARFIQVQAVFELAPMRRWMAAVVERGLHERARFVAAIFPFAGVDRLSFLQKVPGLVVPEHLIERVRKSGDAEGESYRITLELLQGLRDVPGLAGLHMRSIGAEDWVPRLVEDAGLRRAA
ncbi:methylenetetrahydrofolate reductase [Sorangium cellulosum]|jgi:methylenetetrahydrofolate reductase (NADPH)|uniref:Methylenetetrahydrofolate reductase n=1 Tax=Sorangium cellulosum TaxID=56 RepID=A0A4P2QCT4_SORCE|nr:methylenetetrahydrofolate reductase [Sorangium cellulosum]AUX27560.1 methylenetetrahydrofolate reductase [Sorangium cellulosum]